MKLATVKYSIITIIFVVLLILVGWSSYTIGMHNASMSVTKATPLQLAQAMQNDNFYGKYTQTMLLITGKVKKVTKDNTSTIIQFETTNTPSVLGNVLCRIENSKIQPQVGNAIQVLSVAHNALRQNTRDVFMPHCFLL